MMLTLVVTIKLKLFFYAIQGWSSIYIVSAQIYGTFHQLL